MTTSCGKTLTKCCVSLFISFVETRTAYDSSIRNLDHPKLLLGLRGLSGEDAGNNDAGHMDGASVIITRQKSIAL